MLKLTDSENLFNFWQELKSHVVAVKNLSSDIKVSVNVDDVEYNNILTKGIEINEDEIYIYLTPKIRLSIFKKSDYKLYFDIYFEGNLGGTFKVANEEFVKVFKFHKEIQFKDL